MCLCPVGVPLQRLCCKQARRDNRLSDVLESVRGDGIWAQDVCVISEMSLVWLLPAPLTSWLLMSSALERPTDCPFPAISECHGHDHQDSWHEQVQGGAAPQTWQHSPGHRTVRAGWGWAGRAGGRFDCGSLEKKWYTWYLRGSSGWGGAQRCPGW